MKQDVVTVESFSEMLPGLCQANTSVDAGAWRPDNPLGGHCAVVSLVAQNLFGGELLRASLAEHPVPAIAAMRSHYWNRLPDGTEVDFTRAQFGGISLGELTVETSSREHVLSYDPTFGRYCFLMQWVAAAVTGNQLFKDTNFCLAYRMALRSPCRKMWFGCVAVSKSLLVHTGCNDRMPPLQSLCEEGCLRAQVRSRTDAMVGGCRHAEESVLWEIIRERKSPRSYGFYVVGVRPTGLPWFRDEPRFTCARCANQLYQAGVRRIFLPVKDRWEEVTAEEAVVTASEYARGLKRL